MTEKEREQRARRSLKRMGNDLVKSREKPHMNNMGGYMIVDISPNTVVAGARFDLSLEDVEKFISEE